MNTKAFFPFGKEPNLILRICRKNQIFFSTILATVEFFCQIVKNCNFGVKKNITHPDKFL